MRGERRVGVRHLERVDRDRSERDRAERRERRLDPEELRHVGHLLGPQSRHQLREDRVHRMRGRTERACSCPNPQRSSGCHRPSGCSGSGHPSMGVVVGAVPVVVRQVVAVVHRGGQRERLERRSRLSPAALARERGEVDLAPLPVPTAHHREDLARLHVDRHERRRGLPLAAGEIRGHGLLGRTLQVEVERRGDLEPTAVDACAPVQLEERPPHVIDEVLGVTGGVDAVALDVLERAATILVLQVVRARRVEVAVEHHLVERVVATEPVVVGPVDRVVELGRVQDAGERRGLEDRESDACTPK